MFTRSIVRNTHDWFHKIYLGVRWDIGDVEHFLGIQCCAEIAISTIQSVKTDNLKRDTIRLGALNRFEPELDFSGEGTLFWDIPPAAQFGMFRIEPDFRQIKFGINHRPDTMLVIKQEKELYQTYGSNLLGAIIGGACEYISLVTGIKFLLGIFQY